MPDEVLQILKLRAELLELGSAIRQLRNAGMDSAAARLLMTHKRAELEDVTSRRNDVKFLNGTIRTPRITRLQQGRDGLRSFIWDDEVI